MRKSFDWQRCAHTHNCQCRIHRLQEDMGEGGSRGQATDFEIQMVANQAWNQAMST